MVCAKAYCVLHKNYLIPCDTVLVMSDTVLVMSDTVLVVSGASPLSLSTRVGDIKRPEIKYSD